MKYIIESHEDLMKLGHWYCENKITADEYFAAVDDWAMKLVKAEVG